MYSTVMVPQSGWPVTGQSEVNSGKLMLITYGRWGKQLGKASSRATLGPPSGD